MVQRVLWTCILPAIASRASASCHTAPDARARAGARHELVHRAILLRPDRHRIRAESLHLLPSPVLQPPQALTALAPISEIADQKRAMTKPNQRPRRSLRHGSDVVPAFTPSVDKAGKQCSIGHRNKVPYPFARSYDKLYQGRVSRAEQRLYRSILGYPRPIFWQGSVPRGLGRVMGPACTLPLSRSSPDSALPVLSSSREGDSKREEALVVSATPC